MTAADLAATSSPSGSTPISTTYRGWKVYELPPNSTGHRRAGNAAASWSGSRSGEFGYHSTKALHVMIEAKKLAYADMLRYVADPTLREDAGRGMMLDTVHAGERAKLIDMTRANCDAVPSVFQSVHGHARRRHDLPHGRSTRTGTWSR